jgi:RHS repeat-associated protein
MALTVVYSNAFGGVFAENRGGTVSNYVPDTLGSTIGLTDSAGSLTDRWEYWPYGEVVSRNGSNVTPLTFLGILGYFQDVVSQFFYVRARHLRVNLARWLTADPKWPHGPAYGYCNQSPQSITDPTGLDCGSNLQQCLNFALEALAAAVAICVIGYLLLFLCAVTSYFGAILCGTIAGLVFTACYAILAAAMVLYLAAVSGCYFAYGVCELANTVRSWWPW